MYTADKITDLNQDKASILKPKLPPVTAKPSKTKTTSAPAVAGLSSWAYFIIFFNILLFYIFTWCIKIPW